MRARAVLLLCAMAMACRELPAYQQVALDYVKANRDGDCEAAWDLLSPATQQRHRERLARTPVDPVTRKQLRLRDMYCSPGMYKEWDLDSMVVRHYSPDRATIGFRRAHYSGFGGPFFPRTKNWHDVTIEVARERDRWVVVGDR